MDGWQVPGLALGFVQDGSVTLARTYGIRDIETQKPVRPDTLFGIGSITKSVTALTASITADDGGPLLDQPLRPLLGYLPPHLTLRHLLSHSSGWPRHDALWYLDSYSRDGLSRRLASLPVFARPGAAFQYNNVTYAVAGQALQQATAHPWEQMVRRRILRPAGMTDSVTTVSGFRSMANRATGYFPGDEGRIPIDLRDTDPVAPAAGLYAPLTDMVRYLNLLASRGRLDGRQVVSAKAVDELFAPAANAGNRRYGLGLNLGHRRGERIAWHPGVIDGFGARISVLPDRRAGVIVLTNMSGRTPVAQIVSQTLLDCYLKAPPTDWVARFGTRRPAASSKPPVLIRVAPDRAPAAYTGHFSHPSYGDLILSAGPDGTTLSGLYHRRALTLEYAGSDSWRLTETHWPLREGLLFQFSDAQNGLFRQFTTPLADGPTYRHKAGPLLFKRRGS